MARAGLQATILLAALLLASPNASAEPLTLFSSFGPTEAIDLNGALVNGGPPDPASQGLRIGFHAFADVADYVQLDSFDSIIYGLSTTQDWSDEPGLAVYMSLFADDVGTPGAQLAGAYVYWPLTAVPTVFRASSGFPFSQPLSTSSFYWFTLSVRNGEDGSFDPSRTMTWHYAEGTRTQGLRLIGSPIPEPALGLLLAAGVLSRTMWIRRRRERESCPKAEREARRPSA